MPRRPSASAQRPLGNPCRGKGQKHVWVCGRSCGRNVQVPRFQHLRRAAALIGNRASAAATRAARGCPGPVLTPLRPQPRCQGLQRPRRDVRAGDTWGWPRAPCPWGWLTHGLRRRVSETPPSGGPPHPRGGPERRLLPLPPPSPRKTRAPAPASLAGNPGLSNGGGGGGRRRNVTLRRWPRRTALPPRPHRGHQGRARGQRGQNNNNNN